MVPAFSNSAHADSPADQMPGHRSRMRAKLLDKGSEALSELALLEMLLYAYDRRGDTKHLAKALMRRFGSLSAVLWAPAELLAQQSGMGDASVVALKIVEPAGLHLRYSDIENRHVLTSWSKVLHFCVTRLAHEPVEHFMILCLDNRKRLIAEEVLSLGTVDQTPICLREVINPALLNHAKAVILVHSHPSGKTEPPRADIDMTAELKTALFLITITLQDHLIIAAKSVVDFKSLGLL